MNLGAGAATVPMVETARRKERGVEVFDKDSLDKALARCEDEPIHIPGCIQPHGYLLVLREGDFSIVNISANLAALLATDVTAILRQPLIRHFGDDFAGSVARALCSESLLETNPVALSVRGRELDGVLIRTQGLVLLELEPRDASSGTERVLARAIRRLQAATDLNELRHVAVAEIRNMTGYDRVMLYRFGPTGDGTVWAEATAPDLDPFAGLHFPATDIPKQARELYRKNWIRIIPDSSYTPVPIVPDTHPETDNPLDLSYSLLRSVSPIHLEYMRNMGLSASMSISLLQGSELWGLISCGHTQPKFTSFKVREACQTIGQILSIQIDAFEQRAKSDSLEKRRPICKRLMDVTSSSADSTLIPLSQCHSDLLALTESTGTAIVVGQEVVAIGDCPPHEAILELSRKLFLRNCTEGLFACDHVQGLGLSDEVKHVVSGSLAIWLPRSDMNMIIWFRPELVQTVNWAGDPNKAAQPQEGAQRLSPRKSFELWKQQVRGQARQWSATDIEIAAELRRALVEIDLGRQVEAQKAAVQARDDLVAVVSHDLRSPLMTISLQAAMLKRDLLRENVNPTPKQGLAIDRIGVAADRMSALLKDLLDLSLIEAGRVHLNLSTHEVAGLVEDAHSLMSPLADEKQITVTCHCEPGLDVEVDDERLFQVFSNLVGNAIKFTPEFGVIEIRAKRRGKFAEISITDTGQGIAPEKMHVIFDRYWQARPGDSLGAGLGLYITKGIVEAHRGNIWVESRQGFGSAFYFTIPMVES